MAGCGKGTNLILNAWRWCGVGLEHIGAILFYGWLSQDKKTWCGRNDGLALERHTYRVGNNEDSYLWIREKVN